MRWRDMRGSDNVEDREGARPAGLGAGFKLGGVGLVVVVGISLLLVPSLTDGATHAPPLPPPPRERTASDVVRLGSPVTRQ